MDKSFTLLPRLDALLDEFDALDESDWFDFWHTHVDWKGDGNQSVEARRLFLQALFRVFEKIELVVTDWKKPAQVWVIIEEKDSSQDAVYLHTLRIFHIRSKASFGAQRCLSG